LILSPHPDDACLSAFSLVQAGEPVTNVFAGVPPPGPLTPWDVETGATDTVVRARERLAEDRAALAGHGVQPLNLPLLDHQHRAGPLTADAVAQAIAAALGGRLPGTLFAPVAAGAMPHADHRLVRDAALTLGRANGTGVVLYADQPYSYLWSRWPGWVVQGGEEAPWWQRMAREVAPAYRLQACRVVRLDERQRAQKERAIRAYRTEHAALNLGGVLDDPSLYGIEVFWDPQAQPQAR
jgi:LmbE family N-acetylglucosaminyl deacetylase